MYLNINIYYNTAYNLKFYPTWERTDLTEEPMFSVSLYINRIYVTQLENNSTNLDNLNISDIALSTVMYC
jgi:hypothetical protein